MRISDWSSDVCSSDLKCRVFQSWCLPGAVRSYRIGQCEMFMIVLPSLDWLAGPGSNRRPPRSLVWALYRCATCHQYLGSFRINRKEKIHAPPGLKIV